MKFILLTFTSFVAITALISGALMIYWPDGHVFQLSLSLLSRSPFSNFFIPGLVLLVLVGGSNGLAAIALLTNRKYAADSAMVAGISICGWMLVQLWITGLLFWLQLVYLAIGFGVLLLAFQLKRKWLV